jgi:hypothetical protein
MVEFEALTWHLPGSAEEYREEHQSSGLKSGVFQLSVQKYQLPHREGSPKMLCGADCGKEQTVKVLCLYKCTTCTFAPPWFGCHKHPHVKEIKTSVRTQPHPLCCTRCEHVDDDGNLKWLHLVVTSDLLLCASEVLNMRIFAALWFAVVRPEGHG